MPCHVGGGGTQAMTLGPICFIVIEGNGFSKLKGFLKHDHFVYTPTQFNLTNKKGTLSSTKIQNNENKKRPK